MYPDWLYEDYAVYVAESRACGYEYLSMAEWAGEPFEYEGDEMDFEMHADTGDEEL